MLELISNNQKLLSLALDFGMLMVWLAYLHIFVASYLRQQRSLILISVAAENGLDTRCLVANMSVQPIYVLSVIIDIEDGDRSIRASVTEISRSGEGAPHDATTRQGPVKPGEMRDIGRIGDLLDHACRSQAAKSVPDGSHVLELEISIIAEYTSEPLPVAAARTFALERDAGWAMRPLTAATRQVRSHHERRKLWASILEDAREQQKMHR